MAETSRALIDWARVICNSCRPETDCKAQISSIRWNACTCFLESCPDLIICKWVFSKKRRLIGGRDPISSGSFNLLSPLPLELSQMQTLSMCPSWTSSKSRYSTWTQCVISAPNETGIGTNTTNITQPQARVTVCHVYLFFPSSGQK